MWLLSILLLLLFTFLPSMAMNTTTTDDFVVIINLKFANCSNSCSSGIYNVSDLIDYRERQGMDTDSIFTNTSEVRTIRRTLTSTFIIPFTTRHCEQKDGIRHCQFRYQISGEQDYDRIRKFAFRLLTPLSLQDDYTCCWSFDSVQINRNFNDTVIKKNILPFNNSNVYAKQPPTCVHSNVTWICPRTSNKTVFESDVFIGNYTSHSVTYANPDNCDDDRFQQIDILPTCVFQTDNEPAITMQSSSGSIISSSVWYIDTSTITSIGQSSSSIMVEPTPSFTLQLSINDALPSPSNVAKMCVSDGVWDSVSAGTNVTLSTGVKECYNGTVEAIRFCYSNGSWDSIQCLVSSTFNDTLNQIITAPVEGLQALSEAMDLSLPQSVVLLDKSLRIALKSLDDIDTEIFVENFLNVSTIIILSLIKDNGDANINDDTDIQRTVVSQLLQSLDDFALTFIEPSENVIEFSGSFLKVTQVDEVQSITTHSSIVGIEVGNNSITLPKIIFKEASAPVRIGSFLFPDLSLLLPPLDTNSSIISPIISSTINCKSCPVTDLTEPVLITLQIEKPLLYKQVSCVFYDFISQDGLLPTGDWNSNGCTTEVNGDLVTCSCNHLTHFAILLSPGGPEISAIHYKVLNTIGLVLVPISLLCMVLVILTYALIRSLWSIRNYIHIMLCASLFMAQLVFIIGVDKIENQSACSAVAVILLYLFLVTFMWMLMEGVVLYVTLVRVLITNHKYYIIAFTVASYVVPAVYVAVLILLGYVMNTDSIPNHTHFLYYAEDMQLTACWLNYSTGFIWSFIAPVIVIIMINIIFFIMTIVIAQRHSSKHKMGVEIRHWLQATISLTVVMGIAWLGGVLAFRRELLSVAYTTTIFIAAQGIILFIVLVLLSKQARRALSEVFMKRKKLLISNNYTISNNSAVQGRFNCNKNPRHDQKEFVTGKDTSKVASVQLTISLQNEQETGFLKTSKA